MKPGSPSPRQVLERIFGLGTTPGVVVSRATPQHLADEVLREFAAAGIALIPVEEYDRLIGRQSCGCPLDRHTPGCPAKLDR